MRASLVKIGAACAIVASLALWSGSVIAETCVQLADDAYMSLLTNGSATVTCWDAGDQPNPGQLPQVIGGPGPFLDGNLSTLANLTTQGAKSDGVNADFFNILGGSLTSGLAGSFTVDTTGSLGLLFKSGRGQNTPSWWYFVVAGLAAGEVFTWNILGDGPVNGLSHVSAYVPLPPAVWLLGSGLLTLFGIRRRRGKVEPVAA